MENSIEHSNAWKKTFAVMWLAQFIGMSAITGVVSFLPLYVTHLGVTGTGSLGLWAGVLMGAGYMAVTAPVCPACGCQGEAPKA